MEVKWQNFLQNPAIKVYTTYVGALSNFLIETIYASFVELWLQWKLWILSSIHPSQPEVPAEDLLFFN